MAKKDQIEYAPNGAEFQMDAAAYKKAQDKGKVLRTTGILNLNVGDKTGPWEVVEVDPEYQANKKYEATTRVTARCNGQPMYMPIATSFVEKFNGASLAKGDTFLLERVADYQARGKTCEAYVITVLEK